MSNTDRTSEQSAKNVFSLIVPEPHVRDRVLQEVSYYWTYAQSVAGDVTFTTLFPRMVRITVGTIDLLYVNQIEMLVNYYDPDSPGEHYKSAPYARQAFVDHDEFLRIADQLRPMVIHLIERLALKQA